MMMMTNPNEGLHNNNMNESYINRWERLVFDGSTTVPLLHQNIFNEMLPR